MRPPLFRSYVISSCFFFLWSMCRTGAGTNKAPSNMFSLNSEHNFYSAKIHKRWPQWRLAMLSQKSQENKMQLRQLLSLWDLPISWRKQRLRCTVQSLFCQQRRNVLCCSHTCMYGRTTAALGIFSSLNLQWSPNPCLWLQSVAMETSDVINRNITTWLQGQDLKKSDV